MAIDFTSLSGGSAAPVEVTPVAPGVSLNLSKGAVLDLQKADPGLVHAQLCAGWDAAVSGADIDIDISCFMCNQNDKITSATDVVFYNNPSVPGVKLNGDNRTGAGEGDDETMDIDLNQIPAHIKKLVCVVSIHEAQARRQTFGMVNNSYVRLVNKDTGAEISKFSLKTDGSTYTTIIFAELVKSNGTWAFHALGEGNQSDLNGIAALFS